jgi:exopolysaccharide production protein ExoZ
MHSVRNGPDGAMSPTKLFAIMYNRRASSSRILGLDWLRGIAALWVVLYHLNITIQKAKYFDAPSMGTFAETGYRGVELFFVLSGFVMAASTPTNARNNWGGLNRFLIRRVFRIFPAYLCIFLALYAVALIIGQGKPDNSDIGATFFLQNLFLVPRDDLTTFMPVVSWTLTHELMFYAAFSLVFIRLYVGVGILVLWAAICLVAWSAGVKIDGWLMQLNVLNAYFIIGVTAFHLSNKVKPNTLVLSIFSTLMLAAAISTEGKLIDFGTSNVMMTALLYATGFTSLVIASSNITFDGAGLVRNCLNFLGRHSFGVYLVHYPIIVIFAIILSKVGFNWPVLGMMVTAIPVTLFVAWVIYKLVEAPFINLARHLTTGKG